MEGHQVFNNGPRGVHDRQFSKTINNPTDEIELYEDEKTRLVLQANLSELRIPFTQYAPHFPGLAHTKLQRLEDLADTVNNCLADIKQTTQYTLHRDFGSAKTKPHEFLPEITHAPNSKDPKKYLRLAEQFPDVLDLKGSVWKTHTYNLLTRKTYLAATRFSIVEYHKKEARSILDPGKKTTYTCTRYLSILPHSQETTRTYQST